MSDLYFIYHVSSLYVNNSHDHDSLSNYLIHSQMVLIYLTIKYDFDLSYCTVYP